jgi:hypothetical protein
MEKIALRQGKLKLTLVTVEQLLSLLGQGLFRLFEELMPMTFGILRNVW